jgi:uncharacterized membrane protein
MEEWLVAVSKFVVVIIDTVALVAVGYGTVMAFIGGLRVVFAGVDDERGRVYVWLKFSRWLVAGLTFLLAADIVESLTATSWASVARLAAIAVIRTFLNYFLERDLKELRERKIECAPPA